MTTLPWFPCYPSKLLGAFAGMTPDEGYVYWIVCLRIYETGHACRDTADALSRRTGLTKRRVSHALDLSFQAGRLVREGDGIMNPFAAGILAESITLRDKRSGAGQKGANRRWGKVKEKQRKSDSRTIAEPMANDNHLHLHKQKNSEPKKVLRSIPDDWVLSESNVAVAIAKRGWTRDFSISEGERFRDYCLSTGKKYRDFDAAWRNWVTSPFQNGNGNGHGPRGNRTFSTPGPAPTGAAAILAGVARSAARRGLIQSTDRPEDGEVQRGFDLAGGPNAK